MRWQEINERVYREAARKTLAQLTLDDLKAAVASDPDGVADQFMQTMSDWAPLGGDSQEEQVELHMAQEVENFKRNMAHTVKNGRVEIYREVYIDDAGQLRRDDLGACWTPHEETAHSYNGGDDGGHAHVIHAWIEEKNVDWGSTLILRVIDESEDEIRIFSSSDVHFLEVMKREADHIHNTEW